MLFDAAIPVPSSGLHTLAPVDMVVHSAVHRFTEGEHPRAIRDLIDIHDLVMHFQAEDADFLSALAERAAGLGLERPVFYAIRYCCKLLGTEVPDSAMKRFDQGGAPTAPVRMLMDVLVPNTFLPHDRRWSGGVADWLLYVRGHYLRMPWRLLIPHLARKAFTRSEARIELSTRA